MFELLRYIIVHNIDGKALRSVHAQTVLSLLADIPNVHMIASIDHILAPLCKMVVETFSVWDFGHISRFRWLWHDVTTFSHYDRETGFDVSPDLHT